jgi:hypothetical protein
MENLSAQAQKRNPKADGDFVLVRAAEARDLAAFEELGRNTISSDALRSMHDAEF